jgi:hypothetical protein
VSDDNTLGGRERAGKATLAEAARALTKAATVYGFEYRCWAFDRAADVILSMLADTSVAEQKYELSEYTEKFAEVVRRIGVLADMLNGKDPKFRHWRNELELRVGQNNHHILYCPCEKREAYLHTEKVDTDLDETFIMMSCECCDRFPVLKMNDHKGNIHIRWLTHQEEQDHKKKSKLKA